MSQVTRRELGFWKALTSLQVDQLFLAPEFLLAIIVGGGGGVAAVHFTTLADRHDGAGDYLLILGPLIGVVLAALALVISLMNNSYLLVLQDEGKPTDVLRFLRPFVIAIGIQSFSLLLAVAYRMAADYVRLRVEQGVFVVLSFLFVWSIGEVVAVTRNLFGHAVLRAQQARTEAAEEGVLRLRPGQAKGRDSA